MIFRSSAQVFFQHAREIMRRSFEFVLIMVALLSFSAQATTVVPWAQRNTVDSDGDTIADLFDNAPGAFDPSQTDTDNDLIGDIIDPTPVNSNPFLGDPGLGLFGPYIIPAGSSAQIGYVMQTTPPGAFGHIDIDFGGDNVFDATYFGPLDTNTNTISIPPGLFSSGLWDLNVANAPAYYDFYAKAVGPGMTSQNPSITGVSVTPEPMLLAPLAALALATQRRRGIRLIRTWTCST
jgi:hypothetical protein